MLRQEKMNFAREAVSGGIVLLQNKNNALPLSTNEEIALFGIASYRCFRMGWGSGDMLAQKIVQIDEGLIDAGFKLNKEVYDFCQEWANENCKDYQLTNRNWDEWTFRFNEIKIDEAIIKKASQATNTAIVTIGRCSGEARDLKNEEGFLKLHQEEVELIKSVSKSFKKTVLLLNTCGMLDLRSIDDCNIDAILDVSLGGEMFGYGVADVISGKVSPSGKLAMTWANKCEDYPTNEGLETLFVPYNEGIYVGYRYFDTFNVTPRYPFGFGLSYTEFKTEITDIQIDGSIVSIYASVKNVGNHTGREVLQCYLSSPEIKLEKAYQELCAYTKTDDIKPGESCDAVLTFDMADMAHFDPERAYYILENGKYYVRVGNSSRNTNIVCAIDVKDEIICCKVKNRLVPKQELSLLSNKNATPYTYDGEENEKINAPVLSLDTDAIESIVADVVEENPPMLLTGDKKGIITLEDVLLGNATVEELVAQFSDEELAAIHNGVVHDNTITNMTVGSMSKKVRGAAGEMWESNKYKIPVNACADGPAGVRLSIFGSPLDSDSPLASQVVAYPSGTMVANSWDIEAARRLGECVRDDLILTDIEGWLAPGINIQRNPKNGRNFEYLSEEPLIAGKIGAYITIGVQYDDNADLTGKYTTIKHFACNNIEYERGVSDSQASERALREIYLKGFKIAVEEGRPHAIMTAYNRINGEFASTSYDLLEGILRGEWNYSGIVMTDWNTCADAQRHSHAGNDLIMPGKMNAKILDGVTTGKIKREDLQKCAVRLINLIIKTNFARK